VRYKKLRDRIRQVTRILGPGRDLDTQIAFLEKFASSKKGAACRPDLARLLRRLSQERSRMQPAIVKVLERTSSRDLADEVLRGLKSHSLKKTGKGLARRTRKNLRKMVSCDRWTGKKRNVPRLHQLRIAAKHLRYSLEDLRLFFPGKFSVFISAARQVQKHLGDMHNYYTWRKNSGKDAPAALDQELGKLQDRAHSCFLRAWRRQKDQRLWKKLRRALP
jgi:CHAD domain-containing protein